MAGVEDYEWDPTKSTRNIAKHGLDFADVLHFDWISARLILDDAHEETRTIAVGYIRETLVVFAYTERGERTRILSLRRATSKERRRYEQAEAHRRQR